MRGKTNKGGQIDKTKIRGETVDGDSREIELNSEVRGQTCHPKMSG
jgi:hypothetical protein